MPGTLNDIGADDVIVAIARYFAQTGRLPALGADTMALIHANPPAFQRLADLFTDHRVDDQPQDPEPESARTSNRYTLADDYALEPDLVIA